jgi:hypothetical protein
MRDEEGEPIHTIRHRGIRDAKIAATLAAQKTRADMRREPDESPGRGQDEPSPGDRPNARRRRGPDGDDRRPGVRGQQAADAGAPLTVPR